MRLPVCVFDIESDMLCPSCQERLDSGQITGFDIEFSKWILEKAKTYPDLEDLTLLRAIKTDELLILVVKKKNKEILTENGELLDEIVSSFGKVLVVEGPAKLRTIVRNLIYPAIEVGVNSLFLPNGIKENIVVLKPEDRSRIKYSSEELRVIASAVTGESAIFQYQDERVPKEEDTDTDVYGEKLKGFSGRTR
jgi:transcription antitermination factor NusA-like protein